MKNSEEKSPEIKGRFPSWFRPLAFIVVETFLWTTLSFDIALAFEHHAAVHLRPKASTLKDGGVKGLREALRGEELLDLPAEPSVAEDGARKGKPFRGKYPTLHFLHRPSETGGLELSGFETDIMKMAIAPSAGSNEGLSLSNEEAAAFFRFARAVGFEDLMMIQNMNDRLNRVPEGDRRRLLQGAVPSLKKKVVPVLPYVLNPFDEGLAEILLSGTEELNYSLQSRLSGAFAKASEVKGTPVEKLAHLRNELLEEGDPSKARLLRILELIAELQTPEAKRKAIVAFTARYLFSVENSLQLVKIFGLAERGSETASDGARKTIEGGYPSFEYMHQHFSPAELALVRFMMHPDAAFDLQGRLSVPEILFFFKALHAVGFENLLLIQNVEKELEQTALQKKEIQEAIHGLQAKIPPLLEKVTFSGKATIGLSSILATRTETLDDGVKHRLQKVLGMIQRANDRFAVQTVDDLREGKMRLPDSKPNQRLIAILRLIADLPTVPEKEKAAVAFAKRFQLDDQDLFHLQRVMGVSRVMSGRLPNEEQLRKGLNRYIRLLILSVLRKGSPAKVLAKPTLRDSQFSDEEISQFLVEAYQHPDRLVETARRQFEEARAGLVQRISPEDLRGYEHALLQMGPEIRGFLEQYALVSPEGTEGRAAVASRDRPPVSPLEPESQTAESSGPLNELLSVIRDLFVQEIGYPLPNDALELFRRPLQKGQITPDQIIFQITELSDRLTDKEKRAHQGDRIYWVRFAKEAIAIEPITLIQHGKTPSLKGVPYQKELYELMNRGAITNTQAYWTKALIRHAGFDPKKLGAVLPAENGSRRFVDFGALISVLEAAGSGKYTDETKANIVYDFFRHIATRESRKEHFEDPRTPLHLFGALYPFVESNVHAFIYEVTEDITKGEKRFLYDPEGKLLPPEKTDEVVQKVSRLLAGKGRKLKRVDQYLLGRVVKTVLTMDYEKGPSERTRDGGTRLASRARGRLRRAFHNFLLLTQLVYSVTVSVNPPSAAAALPARVAVHQTVSVQLPEPEFSEPRVETKAVDESNKPILSRGSRGESVADLQRMLEKTVHFDELGQLLAGTGVDIPNLIAGWKIDGLYGWRTEAMVYAFQTKYGLTQDGDVGPATWPKLESASETVGTPIHARASLNENLLPQEPHDVTEGPLLASLTPDVMSDVAMTAAFQPAAPSPVPTSARPGTHAVVAPVTKTAVSPAGTPPTPPSPADTLSVTAAATADTLQVSGVPLLTYDYVSGDLSKYPMYLTEDRDGRKGRFGGFTEEESRQVRRALRGEDPAFPGKYRGTGAIVWRSLGQTLWRNAEGAREMIEEAENFVNEAVSKTPSTDVSKWKASLFAPFPVAGVQDAVFLMDPLGIPAARIPEYVAGLSKAGVNTLFVNTGGLMMLDEAKRPEARAKYNFLLLEARARGIRTGNWVSDVVLMGDPFLPMALDDVELIRKYFNLLADEVLPFDFHLVDLQPMDDLQWANYVSTVRFIQTALAVNGGGDLFVSVDPQEVSHAEYWNLPDGVGYMVKAYATTEAGILHNVYQAKLGFAASLFDGVEVSDGVRSLLEQARSVSKELERLAAVRNHEASRGPAEAAFQKGLELLKKIREAFEPALGTARTAERPYTFVVGTSPRLEDGDRSFFRQEDRIAAVTGETAAFLEGTDGETFEGRSIHFNSFQDQLHVLKGGKTSWAKGVRLQVVDPAVRWTVQAIEDAVNFIRPGVRPKRTEEVSRPLLTQTGDFLILKGKGLSGGIFGASFEVPLADNLGILYGTMTGLRGIAFTHVADIQKETFSLRVVDADGNVVPLKDADGNERPSLNAEELRALTQAGRALLLPRDRGKLYAEATFTVAKRLDDRPKDLGRIYSGNIVIPSNLPTQFGWEETFSEEVIIPAGVAEREITVRSPIAEGQVSQMRMFAVSEVRPHLEFISREAISGREIPRFMFGEERFQISGEEVVREGHEVVFPPLFYGVADTTAYFPFEFHNRGTVPVSRYLYHLVLTNQDAGVTLPPNGETREVVLNQERFRAWIETDEESGRQRVILEPVDGSFNGEVSIGGEVFSPPVFVSRHIKLKEVDFLARLEGNRIILEHARLGEGRLVADPAPIPKEILGVPTDGKTVSVEIDGRRFAGRMEGNRLTLVHEGGLITEPVLVDNVELQPSHVVVERLEVGVNSPDTKTGVDYSLRGYVEGDRIILEPTHDSGRLRTPFMIYDERMLRGSLRAEAESDLETYLDLRHLPPGGYKVSGIVYSVHLSGEEIQRIRLAEGAAPEADEVFGIHGSFRVGKPSLSTGAPGGHGFPRAHSPAAAVVETSIRNDGDAPVTVYPVGVSQNKRTGRVITTDEDRSDPHEAYFVTSTGERLEAVTLAAGEEMRVRVKLLLPEDPLDKEKRDFTAILVSLRKLDFERPLSDVRGEVLALFDQAESVGEEALQSRRQDERRHLETRSELERNRENTKDLDEALKGLREGTQKLEAALNGLDEARQDISETDDPEMISRIASGSIGAVSRGLREASDAVYGVRVLFVDTGKTSPKEKTEADGAYLGDRGILARTEPLLYEVQSESLLRWKFEGLASQMDDLRRAEAGILQLEADRERQREGLEEERAYLGRSLRAGPAAVSAQAGNLLLDALSGNTLMADLENAISTVMNDSLAVRVAELNGDDLTPKKRGFFGKVGYVLGRPFAAPVRAIGSLFSEGEKRVPPDQMLHALFPDSASVEAFREATFNATRTRLEEQGKGSLLQLMDFIALRDELSELNAELEANYKDVAEKEALIAANEEVDRILERHGGVAGVSEKIWRLVTMVLTLQGKEAPVVTVTDLSSLRDAVVQARELLPETLFAQLIQSMDREISDSQRREEAIQRTLASIGRLENEKLPEARTHRDRLAGDLAELKKRLGETLPLNADELRARYHSVLAELEVAIAEEKEAVRRLEAELAGLRERREALTRQISVDLEPRELLTQLEQELEALRDQSIPEIIRLSEEGEQALKKKEYEEAKRSFDQVLALEPLHPRSAQSEEVKEAIEQARKGWQKADEKLKEEGLPVGKVEATKITLAQTDRFLAVAISSMEMLRAEREKKKDEKRAEAFQGYLDKLFALRQKLHGMKEGDDLSSLLVEAEEVLDEAYESVSGFSLRVTGVNLALSFVRDKLKLGVIGLIPVFNVTIPDGRAPMQGPLRELTLGADAVRMTTESQPYAPSFKGEGERLIDRLFAGHTPSREADREAFDLEQKIRETERALGEERNQLKADESLLGVLTEKPIQKSHAKAPKVVTAEEKVTQNLIASREARDRAREALDVVQRDKQFAEDAALVHQKELELREAQIAFDSAVADSLAEELDASAQILYRHLVGRFEASEAMVRAQKGYEATGKWHLHTPFHLLKNPKQLFSLETFAGVGAAFFLGREEIPGGMGKKAMTAAGFPYPEHPLLSFTTGLVTVSSPDQELTLGAGAISIPDYLKQLDEYERGLRDERPTFPVGVGINFKLSEEDQRLLAKKYLTSKEAAYIIARVMAEEYADELIQGVQDLSRRTSDLEKGKADLARRKEEKRLLGRFIRRLEADSTRAASELERANLEAFRSAAALDSLKVLMARQREAEEGTGNYRYVKPPVPGSATPADTTAKVSPDTTGTATPASKSRGNKAIPTVLGGTALLWLAWLLRKSREWGESAKDGGNKGIFAIRNVAKEFRTQKVAPFTAKRYATRRVSQWEEPKKVVKNVVTFGTGIWNRMGLVDITPANPETETQAKIRTWVRRITKGALFGTATLLAASAFPGVGLLATAMLGGLALLPGSIKPLATVALVVGNMALGGLPFSFWLLFKSVLAVQFVPSGFVTLRHAVQNFYQHFAVSHTSLRESGEHIGRARFGRETYVTLRTLLIGAGLAGFSLLGIVSSPWWFLGIPANHLLFGFGELLFSLRRPPLTEAQFAAIASLRGRSLQDSEDRFNRRELRELSDDYNDFKREKERAENRKFRSEKEKAELFNAFLEYERGLKEETLRMQAEAEREISDRAIAAHQGIFETGYPYQGQHYDPLTEEEQIFLAELLMKYPHVVKLHLNDELGLVGKAEEGRIEATIAELERERPWLNPEERTNFFKSLDPDDLIAIMRVREEVRRVSLGNPSLTPWGRDDGVKQTLTALFAHYRLDTTAQHADVSHFDFGAYVRGASLSQIYLSFRKDKTQIALNPGLFVWTGWGLWMEIFHKTRTGEIPFRKGILALLLTPLTQVLSYYPNAAALRPLRGYEKDTNQRFSLRMIAESDPELDIWSWTFGVFARWIYGHLFTIAPEIVGGEIFLRDLIAPHRFEYKNEGGWIDPVTGIRVPMFYAKFAQELDPSRPPEDQLAAMLDAMGNPETTNTLFPGARVDRIHDLIYLGRLTEDSRSAMGKDGETERTSLHRDLIVSRLIRDDGVLVILPNGDSFLFRVANPGYLNRIAKGAALGMLLIVYLSGRVRVLPRLSIVNGRPVLENETTSGYETYAHEVREADEISREVSEARAQRAQQFIHRQMGQTYTIDPEGDRKEIRLGARVGYDPDSYGMAHFFRRGKAKIFGLIPLSLYGGAGDNNLEQVVKAFYDPEEVIRFVQEQIKEDQRKAGTFASLRDSFSNVTLKIEKETPDILHLSSATLDPAAQEAYALYLGQLLRMRGIDVPERILRAHAPALTHPLEALPTFIQHVVRAVLDIDEAAIQGEDHRLLYEGLFLATSKLYLKAIARSIADPYVTVEGTKRRDLVKAVDSLAAGIGTSAAPTRLTGFKESTALEFFLLSDERGERSAVGSGVARDLYYLSGKAGVMRLGDQTFGEWRGALHLMEKIRDRFFGQDRSWTWLGRRSATHGASELGSELFRISRNAEPGLQSHLEAFLRAASDQGLSIQRLHVTRGRDLVVVADYAGAQNYSRLKEKDGALFFDGKPMKRRNERVERILGEHGLNIRHAFERVIVFSPAEYDVLRNHDLYRTKELNVDAQDGARKARPATPTWLSRLRNGFVTYSRSYLLVGTLGTIAYGLAALFGVPALSAPALAIGAVSGTGLIALGWLMSKIRSDSLMAPALKNFFGITILSGTAAYGLMAGIGGLAAKLLSSLEDPLISTALLALGPLSALGLVGTSWLWSRHQEDESSFAKKLHSVSKTLGIAAAGYTALYLATAPVGGIALYWLALLGAGTLALPGFVIQVVQFAKRWFGDSDEYPAISASEKKAALDEEIQRAISGNSPVRIYEGDISEKGRASSRLDPLFVVNEAHRTKQNGFVDGDRNRFEVVRETAEWLNGVIEDENTITVRRASAPEIHLVETPQRDYAESVAANSDVEQAREDLDKTIREVGKKALRGEDAENLRALGLQKEVEQGSVHVFSGLMRGISAIGSALSWMTRKAAFVGAFTAAWLIPGLGFFDAGTGLGALLVKATFILATGVFGLIVGSLARTAVKIAFTFTATKFIGLIGWIEKPHKRFGNRPIPLLSRFVNIENVVLSRGFVKLVRAYGHEPKAFLANYYGEAEYPLVFGIPFLPGHFKFVVPLLTRKFHVHRVPSELSLTAMLTKLHEPPMTLPVSGYNFLEGIIQRFKVVLIYTEDTLSGIGVTKPVWQPVMPAKGELRMEGLMAIDTFRRFNQSPQRALLYAKGKGLYEAIEALARGDDPYVGDAFAPFAEFLRNMFFMKAFDDNQVDVDASAKSAGFFSYIFGRFTNRDLVGKHITEFGLGDAQAFREFDRYHALDEQLGGRFVDNRYLKGRFYQVMDAVQERIREAVRERFGVEPEAYYPVDPEIVAAAAMLWNKWERENLQDNIHRQLGLGHLAEEVNSIRMNPEITMAVENLWREWMRNRRTIHNMEEALQIQVGRIRGTDRTSVSIAPEIVGVIENLWEQWIRTEQYITREALESVLVLWQEREDTGFSINEALNRLQDTIVNITNERLGLEDRNSVMNNPEAIKVINATQRLWRVWDETGRGPTFSVNEVLGRFEELIEVTDASDGGRRYIEESKPLLTEQGITYEREIAVTLAPQGMDAELFIEHVSFLNPTTRELVGQIKDKVNDEDVARMIVPGSATEELTAERLVKLYALLAHHFNGGKDIEEIRLPEGFTLDQLGEIDFFGLDMIDAHISPDLIRAVFTEQQLEMMHVLTKF